MKAFAAFVMRGPINAGGTAIATLLLGLMLAPFAWLSSAIVALVTLRLGATPGLRVAAPALLVVALAGWLVLGQAAPLAISAAVAWLPSLVLAEVLRRRVRLADMLFVAAAMGALIVVGVVAWSGSTGANWHDLLISAFPPDVMAAQFDLRADMVRHMIEVLAPMMPGVIAVSVAVSAVTSVLLARWWQALLYNPGGFGEAFRSLRTGRPTACAVLAVSALAAGIATPLVQSLALVALAIYSFQGLAVVHGLVEARGLAVGWLVGLYTALVLMMPYVVVALIMLGVVDAWMDYRRRWRTGDTG